MNPVGEDGKGLIMAGDLGSDPRRKTVDLEGEVGTTKLEYITPNHGAGAVPLEAERTPGRRKRELPRSRP